MTTIHDTAVIDPAAELDNDVEVGPYAVVDAGVKIGAGTTIGAHAVITGNTTIGCRNRIFSHACIGTPPQDKKYSGGDTRLVIGDDNTIREFTTLNPGTEADRGETTIGSGNLLMAYVHVAHDCVIGDNCVMSNGAQAAGHVDVQDGAIIGGMSGLHQFVRVGAGSMVGGGSMVTLDVPPYCIAAGNRATLFGLNLVGLKRADTPESDLAALKRAYKILFRDGLRLSEAIEKVRASELNSQPVSVLLDFLAASERGIVRPER